MEVRKVDPRRVAAYRRQKRTITSPPIKKKPIDEENNVSVIITPPSSNEEKKIRVASYSRVSSVLESQKSSIENQETHFEEQIRSNSEWEFAGSYVDEGITGTKADVRPELQRLLEECKLGKIDLILTKSISRFARNTKECLEMVRELNSLGVHIWFERENIHTDSMESEFMLSLLSSFAEDESKSISGNMKWGIRKRFESGTYKSSVIPYGYKKQSDGEWSVNPDEAEVVKKIYSLACNGKGCNQIAQILNEQKIPGPTGKPWIPRTIIALLTNPAYIGDTLYQKTYRDEQFRQVKNHGELDQYYEERHHEAIVTREEFETAQKMIGQRAKAMGYTPRTMQHYCFTGKLVCKACGSPLHRQARDNNSIWICHKHWQTPELCPMKPVGENDLKAAFINCLNKLSWTTHQPDGLLDIYEKMLGKSEEEKNAERLQEIETLLADNRREMRKLTSIIMRERFLPEHRERKTFLTTQEKELVSEKNKILISGGPTGTLQQLKKFAKEWTITDDAEAFSEEIFTEYVDKVEIDSGRFAYFKFKCGLLLIESIRKE